MSDDKSILSGEDCQVMLTKFQKENNWKYISHEVDRITSIEGFGASYYKVKIHYEGSNGPKSESLFLKVLNRTMKVTFEMCMSLSAYEKEELMYVLIKEFNRKGLGTSYAPECHLCRPYLFLLEDVSLQGYRNAPKKDMLDVEHCKAGLKTLAHFHASAIAYEEIISKEQHISYRIFDSHSEYLGEKIFSKTENSASLWFQCTLQGLLHIIDLLPQSEISSEEFKKKLRDKLEASYEHSQPSTKHRNTLLHGDLWSNNFMFKYENGKLVDSILIDYQLLKYGVPAMDVVQMILTNVRQNLRLQHYDELLESYYGNFCEYLQTYGLNENDILSKEDFFKTCDEVRFFSKLHATAGHSMTFLADEAVVEAFSSEETMDKFLFQDRTESITLSYQTCDLFREVLEEDLIEIRDLLFPK